MGERMVHATLDTLNEGVQVGMPTRIHSEREGIDKEPNESIDFRCRATRNR